MGSDGEVEETQGTPATQVTNDLADIRLEFYGVGDPETLEAVVDAIIVEAEQRGLVYAGGRMDRNDLELMEPREGTILHTLLTGKGDPDRPPDE